MSTRKSIPARIARLAVLLASLAGGCQPAHQPPAMPDPQPAEPPAAEEVSAPHEPSWTPLLGPDDHARWATASGEPPAGLLDGGYEGEGWIFHDRPTGDFDLEIALRPGGEGAILLRGEPDAEIPMLTGYALRIGPAGAEEPDAMGLSLPYHPLQVTETLPLPADDWRKLRVEARGSRFRVLLDDQDALEFDDDRFRYGRLGLRAGGGTVFGQMRLRVRDQAQPQGRRSDWRPLFAVLHTDAWRVLRGQAQLMGQAMLLNPGDLEMTIIAHERLNLQDGWVEAVVTPLDSPAPRGPYTLALRTTVRLAWSSVYFVCHGDRLEAVRGSWRHHHPPTTVLGATFSVAGPQVWRFHLRGGLIDAYHFGRRVGTFQDPDPTSGTVSITADNCRILVHSVHYLPGEAEPPGRQTAP